MSLIEDIATVLVLITIAFGAYRLAVWLLSMFDMTSHLAAMLWPMEATK